MDLLQVIRFVDFSQASNLQPIFFTLRCFCYLNILMQIMQIFMSVSLNVSLLNLYE